MVGCVVLNWNGWQDTVACLRSLLDQTAQPLHVFVVDNGSTDDSVRHLCSFVRSAAGPTTFHLIQRKENGGFAQGSNAGIQEALAIGCDFIWLLNNDTETPPDTLAKLLLKAEEEPAAGIVGSVLLYHHDPTQVQAWGGGRVSRWTGTATHVHAPVPMQQLDYLTFASTLIRAEVFRDIGLLYEGGFMYYEDADFCLRLRRTHWKLAVADDTAILHKESASTEHRSPFMEMTIARSGIRFLQRHAPLPLVSVPVFILLKLGNRVRLGEWAAFRAVLEGVRHSQ